MSLPLNAVNMIATFLTIGVLAWLTLDMFKGSNSRWWFNRWLIYPVTYILAVQLGSLHLMPTVMVGTVLRYSVNLLFTALSKLDSLAEPVKIHRANPPSEQHERELDWDGPVILSPVAFLLVDACTPWLQASKVVPLSWNSLAVMFLAHYLVVEPIYYVFHRILHLPQFYKNSHVHHHSSVITEAISGTSHPFAETIGYLANFSFPFLVPAWFGQFSYELIPIYFVFFDIMNCIGHCNFECIPKWMQYGPLKYIVYTSAYHSLHHSKYKFNYSLFCPIWDYLGGTVHSTTDSLHTEVLEQEPRKLDAVFLGHGHGLHSMLHLPWMSPYLASHQHSLRWWMVPLQPFTFLWVLFCRYVLRTSCVQRYQFRGTQCATWCLPVTGHFYFMESHRQALFDMILQAVRDADDAGVRYFGLAHLNKAEWLNHGGKDMLSYLEAEGRKIRLVHGNTLTAAAVWQALCEHTQPSDEICFAGATSKIGRVLSILLARRGHKVRMITGSQERFNQIRTDAGEAGRNLIRVHTYEEGVGCKVWVIGKMMSEKKIQALIPPGSLLVDFAVPHVPEAVASQYRYVNGAALSYSPKDTDLTFCHDVPNTVPACLAATIIHAREDSGQNECGEIEIEAVEGWWEKAVKHGFRLDCINPESSGEKLKAKIS
eukprot:TRINITY_DN14966_c0_g3_i1.p1 TRINITY_DN14966_c0_g3~~TRINITY_DN14966_c0_g3_i1.p1  ORF type:complete len:655 (+),score=87.20 TRINITY_DN14966_c0_g3_i1:93-2057(+)